MERVSLTYFVDFVLKVGTPKLSGVKEFKEHRYDHLTDFYKPLREAIVDMHEKGKPDRSLDDFLATLSDERKRRIFPATWPRTVRSMLSSFTRNIALGRASTTSPSSSTFSSLGMLYLFVVGSCAAV